MRISDGKSAIEVKVLRYEYADIKRGGYFDDYYDFNFLMIGVTCDDGNGRKESSSPCLLTCDVEELSKPWWLFKRQGRAV